MVATGFVLRCERFKHVYVCKNLDKNDHMLSYKTSLNKF